MLIPRRIRRRLLLPPGWVALGFLLLLGCQALQPWAGQLKVWNTMQIIMPRLQVDTSIVNFYKRQNLPYVNYARESAVALDKLRPWHDAAFRGEIIVDFLNAAITESAIRNIMADSSHEGGVRVRFLPGATYANLVKVLDIMNYTGQEKYWLDSRHQPLTLYAITVKYQSQPPSFFCGVGNSTPPTAPIKTSFFDLLNDFWNELLSLYQKSWRLPVVILAIIAGLSLHKLFQRCASNY